MTTPKGKILLAKLPKDIVQFCIEPYLMINKEEVRQNYQKLMNQFNSHSPIYWRRLLGGVWNAQNQMNDYVLMPDNYVAGNDQWPDIFFAPGRRKRYEKIRQAQRDRESRKFFTVLCIVVILFIAFLIFVCAYVAPRAN